jgi:5-(carboxyamino)imidazole ribonucleotide synthase
MDKNQIIKPGATIGVVGGGQLAKMLCIEAVRLGYKTHVLSDRANDPGFKVATFKTHAKYDDVEPIREFAKNVDLVTFEFENIPAATIKAIEEETLVRPNANALYVSQDRLREKAFLNENGIKTTNYAAITEVSHLKENFEKFSQKAILKSSQFGYDGKGQQVLNDKTNISQIWKLSSIECKKFILEERIDFEKEISVVIARGLDGKKRAYDPVENIHKNGILRQTIAPAKVSAEISKQAIKIAETITDKLEYVGVLAVEFFVTKSGELLVNEYAPRPHNSGHWTIDGCYYNQFEQAVRAVCGLPLGNCKAHSQAKMFNLIGSEIQNTDDILKHDNAKLHVYGKENTRKGRKMGHYTLVF